MTLLVMYVHDRSSPGCHKEAKVREDLRKEDVYSSGGPMQSRCRLCVWWEEGGHVHRCVRPFELLNLSAIVVNSCV